MAEERNRFEIALPYLGSFVDQGNFSAEEPGIVTVPADDRPPFLIPFFAFRIMVGLGLVMLALSWGGLWLMFRGRLRAPRPQPRWFLRATFLAWPSGFIAVLTGWLTAEVGRQPRAIFGAMRTAEAVTPSLSSSVAMISLVSYFLVYTLIFSAGTLYLYRLLREGPLDSDGSQAGPGSGGGASATAQSATRRGIIPGRPLAAGGPSPAANPAATRQTGVPAIPTARIHRKPGIDGGAT